MFRSHFENILSIYSFFESVKWFYSFFENFCRKKFFAMI
nr:MAG TPA: hypothetical protein [Caudoviricetes sp.]